MGPSSSEVSRRRLIELDSSLGRIVESHGTELSAAASLIEDLYVLAEGVRLVKKRSHWFWEPLVNLLPGLVDKHGDKLIDELSEGNTPMVFKAIKRSMTKKTIDRAFKDAETHPCGDRDITVMGNNLLSAIDSLFEEIEKLDEFNFEYLSDALSERSVLRDIREIQNFVTKSVKNGLPKASDFGSMLSEIVGPSLKE